MNQGRKEPALAASLLGEDPQAESRGAVGWKGWLLAGGILAATLAAYAPSLNSGFIWDDAFHVTRPELRSWHGLYRIWFELGATQQYYPLLHSVFWIEHKLWGDATTGYHLVNLMLHVTAALMVALILRRLAVPGAWLAAAIFALHPVHVESVAWITELKNTLSAVFYLGAMLSYLRFDRTRGKSWYGLALLLFVLGLLSKTVTATLPAALLVIFWWQRGRLSRNTDVLPLVPFFVLGIAGGVLTAWVERNLVGAEGEQFTLTLVERGLIAGRAIWFYLSQLIWPADLVFIYPRWRLSPTAWWQYLFPLAAVVLLLVLWKLRGRARAPLAAALFFVGTLFPALGFLNVYSFIYSFVADHFQYLASLGIITIFSAGVALLLKRTKGWARGLGQMTCVALLAVLAVLSSRQNRMYANIETLYRSTIEGNPDCWMAHNNLGNVLQDLGRIDEAMAHYQAALRIKADYAEAHHNLGITLQTRGHLDEAISHFHEALRIKPDYAKAHNNLGAALAVQGDIDKAMAHFHEALRIKPDDPLAQNNLGNALQSLGRTEEAISHFHEALRIKPDYAEAHYNWGNSLAIQGRLKDAAEHFQKALSLKPTLTAARENLRRTEVLLHQKNGPPD